LGKLFRKCQCYPYIKKAPETASVKVNFDEISAEKKEIIGEALLVGILKMKSLDRNERYRTIGLQPTLAPKYGISFRRIDYYPQAVSGKEFEQLLSENGNNVVEGILKRRMTDSPVMLNSEGEDAQQLSMFE